MREVVLIAYGLFKIPSKPAVWAVARVMEPTLCGAARKKKETLAKFDDLVPTSSNLAAGLIYLFFAFVWPTDAKPALERCAEKLATEKWENWNHFVNL